MSFTQDCLIQISGYCVIEEWAREDLNPGLSVVSQMSIGIVIVPRGLTITIILTHYTAVLPG